VRKKQRAKNKGKAITRVVTVTEECESFFNFFSPDDAPDCTEDEEEMNMILDQWNSDFSLGYIIYDSIVPEAVLWFTGEASVDDSDYEEEEEDEDESYDEDENEETDDEDTSFTSRPKTAKGAAATVGDGEKPPECKNQ